MLRSLLALPQTRGLLLDSPGTTRVRRQIIQSKPFLRRVYEQWYRHIVADVPSGPGAVVELGAGAGFLHGFIEDLITSDVLAVEDLSVQFDAHDLPFQTACLRAIVMTNVLHHVPQPRRFFTAATRCVRPGGAIVMIEPWVSPWSRFVYQGLHHEPFEPEAAAWEFPRSGPLSGANGAGPWIVFHRDRARFEREFPSWRIERVRPLMPFSYLLSGGVSMRTLMPGWGFGACRALERVLEPWMRWMAMFAQVTLVRR